MRDFLVVEEAGELVSGDDALGPAVAVDGVLPLGCLDRVEDESA